MMEEMLTKEQQVATIVFGVKNCGGGFVIINGKLRKIPPKGPSTDKMNEALHVILKEMENPRLG